MSEADRLTSLRALRVAESPSKAISRGRLMFLMCFAFFLAGKCLEILAWFVEGDPIRLLSTTVVTGIFLFLFFAGWVGQHWARWVLAAVSLAMGLFGFVWGWIGFFYGTPGGAVLLLVGLIYLMITAMLTLSGSVHLFARSQKESVNAREMVIIGTVLFMCLCVPAGCLVLVQAAKFRLENESAAFAAEAFQKIFAEKDPYYLGGHASPELKNSATLWQFNNSTEQIAQLGTPASPLDAPQQSFFDLRLISGRFQADAGYHSEAVFQERIFDLDLALTRRSGRWEIDGFRWQPRTE